MTIFIFGVKMTAYVAHTAQCQVNELSLDSSKRPLNSTCQQALVSENKKPFVQNRVIISVPQWL